jgi:hypothetical protein
MDDAIAVWVICFCLVSIALNTIEMLSASTSRCSYQPVSGLYALKPTLEPFGLALLLYRNTINDAEALALKFNGLIATRVQAAPHGPRCSSAKESISPSAPCPITLYSQQRSD